MKINNKIIITGAGGGLGEALINIYSKKKYNVIAIVRSENDFNKYKDLNNQYIDTYKLDITISEDIDSFISELNKHNKYSIIHSASIVSPSLLQDDQEILNKTIKTNLSAPIELTNKLLPYCHNSRILFVSSGLAFYHIKGLGAYSISKAGINAAVRAYQQDVPQEQAVFNYMIPGIFNTKMQTNLRNTKFDSTDVFKAFKKDNRLRSAEMVASYIFNIMENTSLEDFEKKNWNIDSDS